VSLLELFGEVSLSIAEVFNLLIQIVLLFSAQKLMALTLPLCMSIVYIVQKVYLRTSRELRWLELESQSAVYSSFLESVRLEWKNGLFTF
jgi:hypothetical protein